MNDKITIAADDPVAQQHSEQLKSLIVAEIEKQGGCISFADYMRLCLYHPGLGYYSAGSHKLGQGGDFTTAPEISPLFGYSIAHHIHDVLVQTASKQVLEFGAGSGRLAITVLTQLQELDALPEHYFILEPSADLQQRQRALIQNAVPTLASRVQWLSALPESFSGAMLANEVCDAMPVHLVEVDAETPSERCVGINDGQFEWRLRPIGDPSLAQLALRIKQHTVSTNYRAEINLSAQHWLKSVAHSLKQGALFIIDYGYPSQELYCAERNMGSLRCYYRQQAHDNPLILPGLQDITAHVDFTLLGETALQNGLDVAGFHEQSDFLIAGDIASLAATMQASMETSDWLAHSAALKQLLLPHQMGHNFKVLSLTRQLELLPRLQNADRRYQL